MAKFILSAFADEYAPEIDRQIEGLKANGIEYMEIRGVDGTNISDITLEKAEEVHAKLKAAGIGVSSIGSPIGKIKLTGEVCEHVEYIQLLSDASEMRYNYYPEQQVIDIPLPVKKPLGADIPVLEIFLK